MGQRDTCLVLKVLSYFVCVVVFICLSAIWLTPVMFDEIGDKSAVVPGGIRIGSPAMTTRGFTEKDFIAVADYIHEGVQITIDAKRAVSGSKLQDFMKFVASPEFSLKDRVLDLQRRVEALTTQFPMPGV